MLLPGFPGPAGGAEGLSARGLRTARNASMMAELAAGRRERS